MKTTQESSVPYVNIRPEVTILSVLQHLNYRPWFALAEFVDNSLQSYLHHRGSFTDDSQLVVEIEMQIENEGRIVIRDNAGGIHENEFPRAFRAAELPPNTKGLSEFGMGMKSAACWFAKEWRVRTSAMGESVERVVSFDLKQIISNKLDTLSVKTSVASENAHFTEIILWNLHHPPKGRTIGKIKEHLASIYRVFLRNGTLKLRINGEELFYTDPPILLAKNHKKLDEPELTWRKEIDFDFGMGLRVTGFAALRETASTAYAGFALFRRNRLIVGSADETYRPAQIFGNSNSFRYQRLFAAASRGIRS